MKTEPLAYTTMCLNMMQVGKKRQGQKESNNDEKLTMLYLVDYMKCHFLLLAMLFENEEKRQEKLCKSSKDVTST